MSTRRAIDGRLLDHGRLFDLGRLARPRFSIQERNLLGTGRFAKAAVTYGQYTRGIELNFAEPYFLDTRSSAGSTFSQNRRSPIAICLTARRAMAAHCAGAFPIREDFAVQLRYSLYTQKITLPTYLNDCNNIIPDFVNTFPTPAASLPPLRGRYQPLQPISLRPFGMAITTPSTQRSEQLLRAWPGITSCSRGTCQWRDPTSAIGYGLTYNTLDNNKNPTNGVFCVVWAGFCRRRRRRELFAFDRRRADLLRGRLRSRWRSSLASRRHDRPLERRRSAHAR